MAKQIDISPKIKFVLQASERVALEICYVCIINGKYSIPYRKLSNSSGQR